MGDMGLLLTGGYPKSLEEEEIRNYLFFSSPFGKYDRT